MQMRRWSVILWAWVVGCGPLMALASDEVFLLPYFLGNGETGVYFAWSNDGLHFEWLNQGKVVLPAPQWGAESLTRDPSVVFHDGIFHMVWTTSWNSRSMGYTRSPDLREWAPPQKIEPWQDQEGVKNTWAPELHWDPVERAFLILFSATLQEELDDDDESADIHGYDHRPYAVTTRDFRTFTPPTLFFQPRPEASVIDPYLAHDDRGTPHSKDDRWIMVIKLEWSAARGGKNLRLTFADQMQGPYRPQLGPPIVGAGTDVVDRMGEGPTLLRRGPMLVPVLGRPGKYLPLLPGHQPRSKDVAPSFG